MDACYVHYWVTGHNKEGGLEILKFAIELDTETAQFSIATPFPGTPFYEYCKNNGWIITGDWTKYDGNNHAVINYPWFASDEIEEMYRTAREIWEQEAMKRYLKSPRRMLRYLKGRGIRYSIQKLRDVLLSGPH